MMLLSLEGPLRFEGNGFTQDARVAASGVSCVSAQAYDQGLLRDQGDILKQGGVAVLRKLTCL